MERRVTVNDRIERVELEVPEDLESASAAGQQRLSLAHGPCLYLGPRGERCSRSALAGGYCARHHSDPAFRVLGRNYTRVLAATIALVLIVWPYVSDMVRELLRWLASR
ncbi:MAG TPA: hypothetical protein VJS43_05845 [Candidatus Acidoferrales bacterium]|nr:hypothetical protein [Candidatus Acidoferrales bacterium]